MLVLRRVRLKEEVRLPERVATRLYLTEQLAAGAVVALGRTQTHRLKHVLRLAPGAKLAAFNASAGEWLCRLAEDSRGRASLEVEHPLRPPEAGTDLWLLFSPIKRARLDWLVEKATELGASTLLPVWTARTQSERINCDRLYALAIAAAEQCERLSVPEVLAPRPLDLTLADWPARRPLIVCDESGMGEPIADAAARLPQGEPVALLIGPEGGFAQYELDAIGKLPFVSRVGLGPRVLRAETAALAALAIVQAIAGDWRSARPR